MEDATVRLREPEGLYWYAITTIVTFCLLRSVTLVHSRWLWYVNRALRTVWVFLNNCYCIPVYFVGLTLASPLLLVDSKRYWRLEGKLYDTLLGNLTTFTC